MELARHPLVGAGLQDYWLEKLLDHPNVFHRKAELVPYAQIGPALKEAYALELGRFLKVVRADWETIFKMKKPQDCLGQPSLSGFRPLEAVKNPSSGEQARRELKEKLLTSTLTASQLSSQVAAHFYEQGFGLFGRFRAFRWNSGGRALEGVLSVDPIRLENLVGYDEQRKPLLENIQALPKRANPPTNTLIYEAKGASGNPPTVKALLKQLPPSRSSSGGSAFSAFDGFLRSSFQAF